MPPWISLDSWTSAAPEVDTKTPVRAALISFVVNLALSVVLMRPWGTVGLAVAGNVAIIVQALYLQTHLARNRDGLAFHHVAADLGKVIIASAVMGALVAGGWWLWTRMAPSTQLADGLGLVLFIGAGVAVYTALIWALKIEGRDDLAAVLTKMKAKFA